MLKLSILVFNIFWLGGVFILATSWQGDSQAMTQIMFLCAPQTILLLGLAIWIFSRKDVSEVH
jgi:Na+-transporting NADH:ubiquinone oxidoreductase subunit NqrD